MKKALFSLTLIIAFISAMGQQEAIFSQYMFNGIVINPAYTGSQKGPYFTALSKSSGLNVDGGPRTNAFSFHTPLKNRTAAFGIQVTNDRIAISEQTGIYASYAYRILFPYAEFSFGLQGGISSNNTDFSSLDIVSSGSDIDPSFDGSSVSRTMYNFGTGFLLSSDKYYLGVSLPFLVKTRVLEQVSINAIDQSRHLFVNGGYIFDFSYNFKVKPSFLYKKAGTLPGQVDASVSVLLLNRAWVGASYRSSQYVIPYFEIQVSQAISVGYSYDIPVGNTIGFNSHEFLLTYRVSDIKRVVTSPRMF